MTRVSVAILHGLSALGVKYVYGSKPPLVDGDFATTDCSGFTRWLVWKAGVYSIRTPEDGLLHPIVEFTGSVRQFELCRTIPVLTACQNIGCFLFIPPKGASGQPGFRPGHVALSLGHDYTLEARGGEGVCIVKPVENRNRGWQRAGKLDELFEEVLVG